MSHDIVSHFKVLRFIKIVDRLERINEITIRTVYETFWQLFGIVHIALNTFIGLDVSSQYLYTWQYIPHASNF